MNFLVECLETHQPDGEGLAALCTVPSDRSMSEANSHLKRGSVAVNASRDGSYGVDGPPGISSCPDGWLKVLAKQSFIDGWYFRCAFCLWTFGNFAVLFLHCLIIICQSGLYHPLYKLDTFWWYAKFFGDLNIADRKLSNTQGTRGGLASFMPGGQI